MFIKQISKLQIFSLSFGIKQLNLINFRSTFIRTMASLKEIEGDLFSASANVSLANCVAADFDMSAGIAVKFRQMFQSVDELKAQNIRTGGVAVLKNNERYIYYLVTKDRSVDKPTYDTLTESLNSMKKHIIENNVSKLAMPRIGCGIDGLNWDKVKEKLDTVFNDTNTEIIVYNFVPKPGN